jgi:ABC-type polysaccharide transport system permease subunit
MINITYGLMCWLVFMFIVHMMQSGFGLWHLMSNTSKKTLEDSLKTYQYQTKSKIEDKKRLSEDT